MERLNPDKPDIWAAIRITGKPETEPSGSACYGDAHRATLQVGVPDSDGRYLSAPHEAALTEKWIDRKRRRAAERAGAPQEARGGWPKKPAALVKAVRADFRKGFIVRVIAERNNLNPGQVERICIDMPKRPHWRKRRNIS